MHYKYIKQQKVITIACLLHWHCAHLPRFLIIPHLPEKGVCGIGAYQNEGPQRNVCPAGNAATYRHGSSIVERALSLCDLDFVEHG